MFKHYSTFDLLYILVSNIQWGNLIVSDIQRGTWKDYKNSISFLVTLNTSHKYPTIYKYGLN